MHKIIIYKSADIQNINNASGFVMFFCRVLLLVELKISREKTRARGSRKNSAS